MQPLSGVSVVDFTAFLSGPYCTMTLGDFGADVVKVEPPGTGDHSRNFGPFVNGQSYPFAMPNRNKRSIALNLKEPEGLDIARRLITRADMVVENFRPGVAGKLGIGYEDARALNEEIIYCSISGFGQTGPESRRPGFDIIAQGMSGFLRMTGPPGGDPAKFGIAVNDLVAGVTAANALLAAYIRRLREGGGQYIDVALVDAGLALTVWEAGAYFGSGEIPQPAGTRHRRSAPYQAFPTSDGYVTVGASNDRQWERFCREVIKRPDLLEHEEFREGSVRAANAEQLEAELKPIFAAANTASWVQALDAAGIPGGPVLRYDEALAQEQVAARQMVVEIDHPVLGTMKSLGLPAKMSQTPPSIRRHAPLLGQHSNEILTELGFDDDAIDHLATTGVVEYASTSVFHVGR